ncbi:hypothetical protein CH275_09700 [Rhodococcus sp. 06-235-1A]|uniref:hypothetical protein n=1 Tax=Rhodococcus sp. 06-235-1A TaxID=2022508 RepID=UPI000B9C65C1|nr:hypothetical protein [Rhodococcus sp. 06-235-1A]OZD06484.1 hypothetical protein CH275_09700 [Rhodococcus sp. 06-235-1A]
MSIVGRRLIAVLVAVVAVVAIAWSCSSPDPDEPASIPETTSGPIAPALPEITPQPFETTEIPAPINSDAAAAETVIRQALTTSFTWYPSTDTSSTDAFLRARRWFTDNLAAQLSTPATTERGPGAQWEQWKEEDAEITATVSIGCSGCPADTAERIYRVAEITQSAVTSDATVPVDSTTTVWVSAVLTAAGWSVDTLDF